MDAVIMNQKRQNRGLLFVLRYLVIVALDLLILTSIGILCSLVVISIARQANSLPENSMAIVCLACIFGVWYVYYLLVFRKTGRTVAMRLLGAGVIPATGHRLSWLAALVWGVMYSNPPTAVLSFCFILFRSRLTLVEIWTESMLVDVGDIRRGKLDVQK